MKHSLPNQTAPFHSPYSDTVSAMAARGLFIDGGYLLPAGEAEFSSESRYVLEGKAAVENNSNNANNFPVDDLLNFSVEDEVMTDGFFDSVAGDSSTVTGVDSCNSSISGGGCNFNGNLGCRSFTDAPFPASSEICVPVSIVCLSVLVIHCRDFRTRFCLNITYTIEISYIR